MILVICEEVKHLNQKTYDHIVENLDRQTIKCKECSNTGMHVHGYYKRNLKTTNGVIRLLIVRYQCDECKKTHAVLPSFIIPWSSISLEDTVQIVTAESAELLRKVLDHKWWISDDDVHNIRIRFNRHWKQRMIAFSIPWDSHLSENCMKQCGRQFMQIRCRSTIFYHMTT